MLLRDHFSTLLTVSFALQVMSALFGYAITVVPRVYTYYLREDALELMHFKKSFLCKLLFCARQ